MSTVIGSERTPGPWEAIPVRLGLEWAEAYDIVHGNDQQILVNDVASEADAYLIAAAPDLLEALVMLMHCGPLPRMGEWKRAVQNASAAIDKAEGRVS